MNAPAPKPHPPRPRARLPLAALLAAAIAPLAAPALLTQPEARAEDKVPDQRLPANPVEAAAPGDWAQYTVRDPAKPDERLPGERYVVQVVDGGTVSLADTKGDEFRFARGEAGLSALAWLGGFFGEARKGKLGDVTALAVVPDSCEAQGKRYEGARLELTLLTPVTEEQGGGAAGEMRSTFRIWVSKDVRGMGLVRAEAEVDFGGKRSRGVFELEAHGTKSEKPPSRDPRVREAAAATGTAAPAAATGTAAPK
jgi:hypothetical protein